MSNLFTSTRCPLSSYFGIQLVQDVRWLNIHTLGHIHQESTEALQHLTGKGSEFSNPMEHSISEDIGDNLEKTVPIRQQITVCSTSQMG